MPRLSPFHRKPGNPNCRARYHNTLSAALQAKCACPKALSAHDAFNERQANVRAIIAGRPRGFEANLKTIDGAIAGHVAFRALSRVERRMVVYYLAVTEQLGDADIAIRLQWSPKLSRRARANLVSQYRRTWNIPAALPQPAGLAAATDRRELENVA